MNKEMQDHFLSDEKFQGIILSEIKEINVKMSNHIVHIVADISAIKSDIEWLKGNKTKGIDGKQNANIEWNTYFVRGLINAGISILTAIATAVIITTRM